MNRIEDQTVEASLVHLVDRPRSARDDDTKWPGRSAPSTVTIEDARRLENPSLDRESFTLVRHESGVANFYDAAEVRRVYYPECIGLWIEPTGAARVVIFAHDVRNSDKSKQNGDSIREPVSSVH